jgi:hypothetical protein
VFARSDSGTFVLVSICFVLSQSVDMLCTRSGGHPGASWLTAHALDAHCWNQDFTLFASFVPPVLPKLPSAFGNTDLQSAQSELNMFAAATDPRQNSNFPLRFGFLSFPLPPNLISYPYSITQNGEIMDVYQGGLSAYRSSWQHHSLLTITWPACVRAALIGDSNLLRYSILFPSTFQSTHIVS